MTTEQKDQSEPKAASPLSVGAGIAIAGIWLSCCSLLGFLAWMLVTRVDVDGYNENGGYAGLVMAYLIVTLLSLLVATFATYIIRTGKAD